MSQTDDLRARINQHGAQRRAALAAAERELDAMRDDLVAAMDAGVPIAELARIAAVSRPTLYELRRRGAA